jgi:hypothetical protein
MSSGRDTLGWGSARRLVESLRRGITMREMEWIDDGDDHVWLQAVALALEFQLRCRDVPQPTC